MILLMTLTIHWPDSVRTEIDLTMQNLCMYQREKFRVLTKRILSNMGPRNVSNLAQIKVSECPINFAVALVVDVKETLEGKYLTLMDTDSMLTAYYPKSNDSEWIIEGAILGFTLLKTDRQDSIIVSGLKSALMNVIKKSDYEIKEMVWPELKEIEWPTTGSSRIMIVSDVHCGSLTFLKENFARLIDQVNKDPRIKYFVINGDLVDGTYKYPGHHNELILQTFEDQYQSLVDILSGLKYATVLIQPGNHDMVRKVQPQHFNDKVRSIFSRLKGCKFLSNPSYFTIEGVNFYLNHGTGYNEVINKIPLLSNQKCVDVNQYLCRLGNVSPVRSAVPIRPNKELTHIIPQQAHIISAGHMHNQGVKMYKGRLLVNTGAWQHNTPYMKLLGVKASLAKGVCVDLKDPSKVQQYDLEDETTDSHSYNRAMIEKN